MQENNTKIKILFTDKSTLFSNYKETNHVQEYLS
jgi:hypothetical protein